MGAQGNRAREGTRSAGACRALKVAVLIAAVWAGARADEEALDCRIEIVSPQTGDTVVAGTSVTVELALIDCPVPDHPCGHVHGHVHAPVATGACGARLTRQPAALTLLVECVCAGCAARAGRQNNLEWC